MSAALWEQAALRWAGKARNIYCARDYAAYVASAIYGAVCRAVCSVVLCVVCVLCTDGSTSRCITRSYLTVFHRSIYLWILMMSFIGTIR